MTNAEYIEMMVNQNDIIYADASTLMDTALLNTFLEKAAPFLKSAGKQITIPRSVRAELLKHLDSENDEKRVKAELASQILGEYKDLFLVPGGSLDDDEIACAFADAEVLGTLIANRRGHRQLLIANDRDLTRDAFELNDLQSCHGGRISVCHLDRFGQLQMCSCVIDAKQNQDPSGESNSFDAEKCADDLQNCEAVTSAVVEISSDGATSPTPEKAGVKPPEQIDTDCFNPTNEAKAKAESEEPVQKKRDWWKWVLAFTGGAAVGCYAGMYRSEIAQLFTCLPSTV